MTEKELNNKINEAIDAFITEMKFRNIVRKIISEKIYKILSEDNNEYDDEDTQIKRNTVMKLVQKDIVKNSELAYKIWPDMDKDTARSLFSKKVSGEPDNEGNIRKFTNDEISQLYELLRQV